MSTGEKPTAKGISTVAGGSTPRPCDRSLKSASAAEITTAGLLAIVLCTITAQSLVLVFQQPISGMAMPIGLGVALVGTTVLGLESGKGSWLWPFVPPVAVLMISVTALLLGGWLVDFSSDGQWYHQQAIIELLHGWNPLYTSVPPSSGDAAIWIDSYPKGSWMFAASAARTLGDLEAGKALTFILAAGALLTAFAVGTLLLRLNTWEGIAIGTLVACSPVLAYQYATFYVDAQVSAGYAIALIAGILWVHSPNTPRLVTFLSSLVILSLLKFTGLVYSIFLFLAIVSWAFFSNRPATITKGFWLALSALGLCLLVAGFNPYATNTLKHGTPFYPLMGKESIDFISNNVSPDFAAKPRLVKLAASILAESSGQSYNAAPDRWNIKFKVPFQVTANELDTFYRYTDVRIAGLGPWFSGALALAGGVLLLGLLFFRRCAPFGFLVFLLAVVFATLLVNPESWMMRYAPQLWLIPVAIAAVGLSCRRSAIHFAAKIVVFTLFVNIALVAVPSTAKVAVNQLDWRQQLQVLKGTKNGVAVPVAAELSASIQRLTHQGIRFTEVTTLHCDRPFRLVGGDAQVCLEDLGVFRSNMESKIVALLSSLK